MDNVQEPQQNTEKPKEQVQAQQPVLEPVEKKSGRIKRFFTFISRGPWTLLYPVVFGLIVLGGWWLITHPQFVIDNVVNKPNALYTVLAGVGSIIVLWVVAKFFQAIALWTTTTWKAIVAARKEDPIAWFFWVTIYGLLAVSVLGSGAFFENHFPHPIPGVGYAIALMFDLVTINAMRARLEALRTGDRSISWLYMLAIFICTSATIFGNVYSALDHVNGVPQMMKDVAPWLAVIFPSMIIVMSVLADHLLEKTSTRLDATTYRAREEQRLNILVARREMREKMKLEEEKLAKLDAKPKKERRTFFLIRWLFPRDINMDDVVEQATEKVNEASKEQFEALNKQQAEMQKQLSLFVQNAQSAYNNLADLVEKQAQSIASIDTQRDTDNALFVEQIRLSQENLMQTLKGQINDAMTSTLALEKETIQQVVKESLMSQNNQVDKAPASSTQKPIYQPSYEEDKGEDMQADNQQEDIELQRVLENYPIVKRWLSESQKSLTLEEVEIGTGHSRKMVLNRHKDGTLARTKNPLKVTTKSVIEWLKAAPLPKSKTFPKEEDNQPNNNEVIGADMIPETPIIIEANSDPETGEFEAIHNGHNSKYTLDKLEEMTV